MPGVRSHSLPLHGELSTRSLAPAANTVAWFASMASAGSFAPLGKYGVAGLPTVTLLSPDAAVAGVMPARIVSSAHATGRPKRGAVIRFLLRGPGRACVDQGGPALTTTVPCRAIRKP